MKVYTHFAGSTCVVFKDTHVHHHAAWYIDARRDHRYELTDMQLIELVHAGFVKATYQVPLEAAPRTIVALMRNNFQPL